MNQKSAIVFRMVVLVFYVCSKTICEPKSTKTSPCQTSQSGSRRSTDDATEVRKRGKRGTHLSMPVGTSSFE